MAKDDNRRDDKGLRKFIRNTVLLTVLGTIPVLYGMGLLPWETAAEAKAEHIEMLRDIDGRWEAQAQWYNEMQADLTAIKINIGILLERTKN